MNTKKTLKNWKAEDLVDSFVFPIELSHEERKAADRDLAEGRRRHRMNMTEHEKQLLRVMQLKYRLEKSTK